MKMHDIRQGFGSLWDSVTDGWDRLRRSAAAALTRYRPGEKSNLPARDEIDDALYLPGTGWAMIGGDEARATYRNGVLRVELPKAQPGQPRTLQIPVR